MKVIRNLKQQTKLTAINMLGYMENNIWYSLISPLKLIIYMSVWLCVCHGNASAYGGEKSDLGPLELELQVVVSHLRWGWEPNSTSLEKHQVLLTTEQSFQHHFDLCPLALALVGKSIPFLGLRPNSLGFWCTLKTSWDIWLCGLNNYWILELSVRIQPLLSSWTTVLPSIYILAVLLWVLALKVWTVTPRKVHT